MKNILVIVGSGVKGGNTDTLTDAFIKGAVSAGHTVRKVFLGAGELQGCRGCGACQSSGHVCAVRDMMQEIYPMLDACDTVVLASPLYFWTISARLKAFIERLYAISTEDLYPKKDCLLLMTAGDDSFWTFEQPIGYYRFVTRAIGWNDLGVYCAGGCRGEAGNRWIDPKHLEGAYALGASIKTTNQEE